MKILVIEQTDELISDLVRRIEEASSRTMLKGVSVSGTSLKEAGAFIPQLIFLGEFAIPSLDDILKRLNAIFPNVQVALLLPSETYVSDSVDLRRNFPIRFLAKGDMPQIAQLILELGQGLGGKRNYNRGRVISFCQTRGGVGASSSVVSFADAISKKGKSVVALDFSVYNPDITRFSSYGILQQSALKKYLLDSDSSSLKISEIISDSKIKGINFSVVGQLESFLDSYKVFIDAPDIQSATYDKVEALISLLSDEFDFVLIDLGATWGVSTLSALSLSSSVFFLVEGTRQNMIGSFANLARISSESDDPSEFDYRKWTVLVNCLDTLKEANSLYNSIDNTIFGKTVSLFNIPLSSKGSDWCVSGYTLYSHGSKAYIQSIEEIVKNSFPDIL